MEGIKNLTRRSVLSFMAAQYDPLGLGSPLLLRGKLLLRNLHGKEANLKWDQTLPAERAREWVLYILTLLAIPTIELP